MRRQWSFERDMITDHRRALWGSTVTLFFLVHLIGKHTCLRDASPGLRVGTHVGRRVGPGVHVGCSNAGRRVRRARVDAPPCDALRNAPTRALMRACTG